MLSLDQTASPISVRLNPYKEHYFLPQENTQLKGENVPWSSNGFYLDERPGFTIDPLFHAGIYYVQEASSMFLEQVFEQATGDKRSPLVILDLCASPGGKTTHLASMAGPDALVVANEVNKQRAAVLMENVQKWGSGNIAVTQNDPSDFKSLHHFFDVAVIDAPCSGEGMFRKTPAAQEQWSENNVALCGRRQQRILADVWDTVKPGGLIIYSTCTFNRTENEENLRWIAGQFGAEPVAVEADPSWGVVRTETEGIFGFRFYPHRLNGEGLFMSVMRKPGKPDGERKTNKRKAFASSFSTLSKQEASIVSQWVSQPEEMAFFSRGEPVYGIRKTTEDLLEKVAAALNLLYCGVEMGQLFHRALKPSHPLSLFHGLNMNRVPVTELPLEETLHYLRKAAVDARHFEEGINLVTYRGVPVGYVKRVGNRCNNLYPKEQRILHL